MTLGPHIIQPTAAAMAWAAHAPIYKRLGAPAPITRVFWPDDEQNARIASMAVDQTVADIEAVSTAGQWVELFNEVAQRQGAGLEQHADFMAAIVPKLHGLGVKVAGFSFSVGNPGLAEFGDKDDAQYLYNRGFCGVDAIAMHCYFGANQDPAGAWNRAYAFRYRAFHDAVPTCPPILITECGIDSVPGGAKGWKASGLSGEQYLDLLAAFDAELAKDSYVIAACVFTAGPTEDWASFDTDELDTSRFWTGGTMSPSPSFDLNAVMDRLIAEKGYDQQSANDAMLNTINDPNFGGMNDADLFNAIPMNGGSMTPTTPPAGVLEQLQSDMSDLKSRMATIEQREALTIDAVTKLAAIEAVFQPSAPVTGPSGPAADADAIAGGQPVVENQIAQDQAANPQ